MVPPGTFKNILLYRGNYYVAPLGTEYPYVGLAKRMRGGTWVEFPVCFTNPPKIYGTTINNLEATILMDRYDGTLDELIYACQEECPRLLSCLIDGVIARLEYCLEALHQHGIVHNDLTLDNILFSYSGHLVLADYGLARISHDDQKEQPTGVSFIDSKRDS